MTKTSVTIIGTGDFGRVLGKRLLNNNYRVVYGSRRPQERNLTKIDSNLSEAQVMTIEESLLQSDIVILAIPCRAHSGLQKYRNVLAGRVVIDVSNWEQKPKAGSNTEDLVAVLPDSNIVKAFNTVSAYSMDSDSAGESRLVYICGEDPHSRDVVKQLARNIQFVPVDCGGLLYARQLEAIPHEVMPGWLAPTVVFLIIFIFWIFYGTLRYYVLRDDPYAPERWPTNTLNKILGCASLTLLPLAFMPSCIAGFIQLIKGTKYKRFPNWLDRWLKMRKQIGYYALLLAALHMVMSLSIMEPAYFSRWFHFSEQTIPLNRTEDTVIDISSRMTWLGETCNLLGVLGLTGMFIMGIVSLPSVAATLNWIEWRIFQSYLGWLTLVICTSHSTLLGAAGSWVGEPWYDVIQKMTFVGSFVAWVTLLLKIILLLPGICCHLENIRSGYERGQTKVEPLETVTTTVPPSSSQEMQIITTKDAKQTQNGGVMDQENGQVNDAYDVKM